MIRLDYRDSRPIYEQVRDGLRRLMVTGVMQPGEQLPSVRSLAMELAINPQHHPAGLCPAGAGGVRLLRVRPRNVRGGGR